MYDYRLEVRIRRCGWKGLLEYIFKGVTWQREFVSRQKIDHLEDSLRDHLDGVIEILEPINKE